MYTEDMYDDSLYHHGILGQKWGVRRYQNEDGSLTPAGKRKYSKASKYDEKASIEKAKVEYRTNTKRNELEDRKNKRKIDVENRAKQMKAKADYHKSVGNNKLAEKNYKRAKEADKYLKDWDDWDQNFVNNEIIKDRISSKVKSDYYTAKAESIRNKDYKKSIAYKRAKQDYYNLTTNTLIYGKDYANTVMADNKTRLSNREKRKWSNS